MMDNIDWSSTYFVGVTVFAGVFVLIAAFEAALQAERGAKFFEEWKGDELGGTIFAMCLIALVWPLSLAVLVGLGGFFLLKTIFRLPARFVYRRSSQFQKDQEEKATKENKAALVRHRSRLAVLDARDPLNAAEIAILNNSIAALEEALPSA